MSRELKRNGSPGVSGGYHAGHAQRRTRGRRVAANAVKRKIEPGSKLERLLTEKIAIAKWSPEQVVGWLHMTQPCLYVCHQTVYDWIYRHKPYLVGELHCRKGCGHWEGDTVVGAKRSGYLATFVDRKSGYLAAAVLPKADFGAAGFAGATEAALGSVPGKYLKTLALDNGGGDEWLP